MDKSPCTVTVLLSNRDSVDVLLFPESDGTVKVLDPAVAENFGEAPVQLLEGHFYEYKVKSDQYILAASTVVRPFRIDASQGRITPNIYVGRLSITIVEKVSNRKVGELVLEVRSLKASYREDYRLMLQDITEKCVDLLLQHSSPVTQYFIPDPHASPQTLYQRFSFIKSIIDSDDFSDAVHRIVLTPVKKWKEIEIGKDIRSTRKFGNKEIRQLVNASRRVQLPEGHSLRQKFHSVPAKIEVSYKIESVDTHENRFIKYALEVFVAFLADIANKAKSNLRLANEASLLGRRIEQFLAHTVFKDISAPSILKINSPILQRKEGYREVLKAWLMFDLAAKLIWQGGDDVYEAGKKDVAALYEYWLFFKMLDIVRELFDIEPESISNLITKTSDGLGLRLKQGRFLPIQGVYKSRLRPLNIEFSYNRSFKGEQQYPEGGSWTRNFRPDYTLSIWPYGISSHEAELQELIVHIHFDAKYKVEDLTGLFDSDNSLDVEKKEESQGTYRRADLLKMHAYRDAIRRTGGAYLLYPGETTDHRNGFHEIIPGLGAFAVRPSHTQNGIAELKAFIKAVLDHFLNRASQRERMSFKAFEIYNSHPKDVTEPLPEAFGVNRALIPDETFVLVAYYKDQKQLEWIIKHGLYNARMEHEYGELKLDHTVVSAKYLLLHTKGELITSRLLKMKGKGPSVFSREKMLDLKYPDPGHPFYLVFEIGEDIEEAFQQSCWDIRTLTSYRTHRSSAFPFTASLTELMEAKLK